MTLRNFWIRVGDWSYVLDMHEKDPAEVIGDIKSAIENKKFIEVAVLDDRDRQISLCLNGGLIDKCAFDYGLGPRPHEIS